MRSILALTAGDDLDRAIACGPDAILADADTIASVAANAPHGDARPLLFAYVRLLDYRQAGESLDAIVRHAPDGVFLREATGGADVIRLSAMLAAREALAGLADGHIKIIAGVTDTAPSLLAPGSYRRASPRLVGLAWNAEILSTALGARIDRDDEIGSSDLSRLARILCLVAAAAANVAAIDRPCASTGDAVGVEVNAEKAVRDGFTAKIATHPDQVGVINRVFGAVA